MIAWVDGGDGIASYEDCVLSVISYKQFFRDWEAFYQRTWKTQQAESQVASGAGERTTVHTYGNSRDPGYSEVWLTGPDMDLFRAEIVDDDTDPSNGYTDTIMTARPLPAGVYNITNHSRLYEYIACDFHPENNQLRWEVTRVGGNGDGAGRGGSRSLLRPGGRGYGGGGRCGQRGMQPKSFTVGGSSVALSSLKWQGSAVTPT